MLTFDKRIESLLPQMQACMCLWLWLGNFEKIVKASKKINIFPSLPSSSAPLFFGISLWDEENCHVSNALWSPGSIALPSLLCPWAKPGNVHTHLCPSILSGHSKSHTQRRVKLEGPCNPLVKVWICRQMWMESLGWFCWWWTRVPGQRQASQWVWFTQDTEHCSSISHSVKDWRRKWRQISKDFRQMLETLK